jgi:hypothetical protein
MVGFTEPDPHKKLWIRNTDLARTYLVRRLGEIIVVKESLAASEGEVDGHLCERGELALQQGVPAPAPGQGEPAQQPLQAPHSLRVLRSTLLR